MISVSLCMIVKNEEEVLGRCLKNAGKFADEIIIVDTGSEDKTKKIAEMYTDKIFDFPWKNDFSAARNYALDRGNGDYLMWLDADDVVPEKSVRGICTLKEELPSDTDVVMMPYAVNFDEQGKTVFSYYRERIVKNKRNLRFKGKVHEAIPISGKIFYADIPVEHRKMKWEDSWRNLRIYQKMEKNGETMDSRSLYYYGRELLFHGQYKKGKEIFHRFLEREDGWLENRIDATRQMAYCCYGLKQEENALKALLCGLAYDVPRGETCCDLGRHFFDRGKYEEAIYWYKQALHAKKASRSGAFIQEDCYGFLPAISLCVIYDRLGQKEEAKKYNDLAGTFHPFSPYYLQNKVYFEKGHGVGAKQTA